MSAARPFPRLAILALCLLAAAPGLAGVAGPLRVLDSNPRYLTDGTGQVVLLIGSHDWYVFQDYVAQPSCARDPVTASGFLSRVARWGHSFTRGWHWEDAHHAPLPYRQACDGSGYTLETPLNPEYVKRLKTRIRTADTAGLYISVMLFQGWSVGQPLRRPQPWPGRHPYSKRRNCSGIEPTSGRKTHELDLPEVWDRQSAYVQELVRELNEFDNIVWEISNESHPASRDWQIRLVELIRSVETALPKQHPIWMSCAGGSTADLFLGPAEIISPCRAGGYTTEDALTNPRENRGRKVILADSDHLRPTTASDVWAWKSFMRGLQPLFMDQGNYAAWSCNWDKDDPEWWQVRGALGAMLDLAEEVDLEVMAPQRRGTTVPSSGRYGLFSTDEPWSLDPAPNGGEFLVYFRRYKQQIDLCGLVPGRDYEYQWTKATDASTRSKVVEFRQRAGTDCRSFTNQAGFSRVLRVSSTREPPAAVIRTEPRSLVGRAPLTVRFDGSGSSDPDGVITAWEWAIPAGDAVGSSARHVFDSPGRFVVTLTVTDDDGLTSASRVTVEVTAGPSERGPEPPAGGAPRGIGPGSPSVNR